MNSISLILDVNNTKWRKTKQQTVTVTVVYAASQQQWHPQLRVSPFSGEESIDFDCDERPVLLLRVRFTLVFLPPQNAAGEDYHSLRFTEIDPWNR
jgi:hypothetical protein